MPPKYRAGLTARRRPVRPLRRRRRRSPTAPPLTPAGLRPQPLAKKSPKAKVAEGKAGGLQPFNSLLQLLSSPQWPKIWNGFLTARSTVKTLNRSLQRVERLMDSAFQVMGVAGSFLGTKVDAPPATQVKESAAKGKEGRQGEPHGEEGGEEAEEDDDWEPSDLARSLPASPPSPNLVGGLMQSPWVRRWLMRWLANRSITKK